MAGFVLRRLLTLIPVLAVVTFLVLLLLELAPGDPAQLVAGDLATEEQVQAVRERLGTDRPLVHRYVDYVAGAVRGDLGTSLSTHRPVSDRLLSPLPATLSLAGLGLGLAVVLGGLAGTLSALRPRGLLDRTVSAVAAVSLAAPAFVVALVLVTVFALRLSWFPVVGYAPLADGVGEWLRHLILPAVALSVSVAAELARQTRDSLLETLDAGYIRTARAKGLSDIVILGKHAAKNAAIPVVTVLGSQVGRIFGTTIVVETVFALPGFGTMALNAALSRDYPVIQGVVLMTGVCVIAINTLVDVSYGYFNPRARR